MYHLMQEAKEEQARLEERTRAEQVARRRQERAQRAQPTPGRPTRGVARGASRGAAMLRASARRTDTHGRTLRS